MESENLLNFRGASTTTPNVVVMELKSEQETIKALKALQERKTVVLTLSRLSAEKAQRVVDWMAGGTHAIDGRTLWIGENTFLFAPGCVQVTAPQKMSHTVSPKLKVG
jgi:cell division inhibitor SepF